MKLGRWRYMSGEGWRDAIVIADSKTMAYDALPLANDLSKFEFIEWVGESSDTVARVVMDSLDIEDDAINDEYYFDVMDSI